MTEAEQAVIDAARRLDYVLNNECGTWDARVALGKAIVALDESEEVTS